MVRCSVLGCKQNSNEKISVEHVGFYKFPNDTQIQKQWIKACGKEIKNIKNAKICSLHLSEELYTLKDRFLNTKKKNRVLNADALPSLFLPIEYKVDDRKLRAKKRLTKY